MISLVIRLHLFIISHYLISCYRINEHTINISTFSVSFLNLGRWIDLGGDLKYLSLPSQFSSKTLDANDQRRILVILRSLSILHPKPCSCFSLHRWLLSFLVFLLSFLGSFFFGSLKSETRNLFQSGLLDVTSLSHSKWSPKSNNALNVYWLCAVMFFIRPLTLFPPTWGKGIQPVPVTE